MANQFRDLKDRHGNWIKGFDGKPLAEEKPPEPVKKVAKKVAKKASKKKWFSKK